MCKQTLNFQNLDKSAMGVHSLLTMILSVNVGLGLCIIRVVQEPFISGYVNSTISLGCHLSHDKEDLRRITIYWATNKTDDTKVKYLYPPADENEERVKEVRKDIMTDMSVLVSRAQLADTELYLCYGSVLFGPKEKPNNKLITGDGTMLFIHGPILVGFNGSGITCKTQVQMVEDVVLDWRVEGRDDPSGKMSYTLAEHPKGSYWMESSLNVSLEQCVGKMTYHCQLHHSINHNIANASIEVTCKGKLQVGFNGSELTCHAHTLVVEDVRLDWWNKNQSLVTNYGQTQQADGSYWMTSHVGVNVEQCAGNTTFYCRLNHKSKHNIANHSIEVTCKGEPVLRHPINLYASLLGATTMILLLVILVCLKKRYWGPEGRRQDVSSPRYKFI